MRGTLTHLQELDLSFNELSGTIPVELGMPNRTNRDGQFRWQRPAGAAAVRGMDRLQGSVVRLRLSVLGKR
jgi:hypothetical protein